MSESPVQRLGAISRQYEALANAYPEIARESAQAESDYRRDKAVRMLKAKVQENASAVFAEVIANADPDVAFSCQQYKLTAAMTDATQKKLSQLREAIATGRSVLVNEREADRFHAQGLGGAA